MRGSNELPERADEAKRRVPFTNTRFRVDIEGMPHAGVLEVVFPEARLVRGRGSRGKVTPQYGSLILRRGLSGSGEWHRWWDAARRSRSGAKRKIAITIVDATGADAHCWTYKDATPLAYQVSNLNALGEQVLIETLELSVGGLSVVCGPASANRSLRRGVEASLV